MAYETAELYDRKLFRDLGRFEGPFFYSGPTTIYRQRSYQLGTHRLPLLKYLVWSCDHSRAQTVETEDMHVGTVPTMEHQVIF